MATIEIPIRCLEEHTHGQWDVGDLLGEGAYGQVYEACEDDRCDHVMKITSFHNKAEFLLEVRTQDEAADVGLAVPVVDHWVCPDTKQGIMIMPRLDITVFDYLTDEDHLDEDDIKTLKKALLRLMTDFHELGYAHNDLHLSNVMMQDARARNHRQGIYWRNHLSETTYRLYLVDFGTALPFEKAQVEPEVYQRSDREDLLKSFREAIGAL